MSDEKPEELTVKIKRLARQEDFRAFLDVIHQMRESELNGICISVEPKYSLGAIESQKRILDLAGYYEMLKREKGV